MRGAIKYRRNYDTLTVRVWVEGLLVSIEFKFLDPESLIGFCVSLDNAINVTEVE